MSATRLPLRPLVVVLGSIVWLNGPSTDRIAVAQQSSRPATVTDVPDIPFEKYTLPNGLEVILSEDRRLPMVGVNLWYHVGPANEEPGRTGFAHLFEHMMFQSSKHVPPDSHFRLLQGVGATTVNGTTSFDRTNYFETVPSNQLELALWLESDRMGYLLDQIDVAALANQQDVVRNERRQSTENAPYGNAREAFIQSIFPMGHPYHADVIGSHQDIQSARLDDVKRFFKQYYAPNNASLAVVGDIDSKATKTLIEKYFGTLKRGEPVPPIKVETPRITSERRRTVADRVELPRVYIGWLSPSIFKPGDAEARVVAGVLGDGRSSRLYKRLVYERQIAQDVRAFQDSLILGSYFAIIATARPGHTAEEIERAIDEELAAIRMAPPAPSEVERVRNTIETRTVQRLEGLGGFGGVADQLNSYNHYLGDPGYLRKDIERLRAVTPQSVLAFARAYLDPKARVVIHAVPGTPQLASPVPTPPAPASRPGEGAEAVNAPEPWRTAMPKGGAERPLQPPVPQSDRLANGLQLLLIERPALPFVSAQLVVNTGSDANPPNKPGLASFTAAMLDEGTDKRSALQIADEVAQLGASLSTTGGGDASYGFVSSLKKNFAAALDILADVIRAPAFPAEEVERQRATRIGQLVQQRENASTLAQQIAATALYGPAHPYGYSELGTPASVEAFTRDDMVAFWKQNFVPNNAALVVAGNITMGELKPLVDRLFGGWQRGTPARPALERPVSTDARVVIVDKPGAPQTQLRVVSLGAERRSPDYSTLMVMNRELGGVFSSRINMNLREARGYTYGANSSFSFRRTPGPFAVTGGIRTDVTAPAVIEILKEVRGMRDRPMTPDELQRAKGSIVQSLPATFETSAGTVGGFSDVFTYDLGLDYYQRYARDVASVSAAQAQAVARKYVVPENLVFVAVGDRAQIEPELRKLNLGRIEIRDTDGRVIALEQ